MPQDIVSQAKSGKIKITPPPESAPPADKAAMLTDGLTKLVEESKRYVPIPASYAKAESTDLRFTVTGGQQIFEVELKDK